MVQQNYFSDLYPAKISDLSAKPFFPCKALLSCYSNSRINQDRRYPDTAYKSVLSRTPWKIATIRNRRYNQYNRELFDVAIWKFPLSYVWNWMSLNFFYIVRIIRSPQIYLCYSNAIFIKRDLHLSICCQEILQKSRKRREAIAHIQMRVIRTFSIVKFAITVKSICFCHFCMMWVTWNIFVHIQL